MVVRTMPALWEQVPAIVVPNAQPPGADQRAGGAPRLPPVGLLLSFSSLCWIAGHTGDLLPALRAHHFREERPSAYQLAVVKPGGPARFTSRPRVQPEAGRRKADAQRAADSGPPPGIPPAGRRRPPFHRARGASRGLGSRQDAHDVLAAAPKRAAAGGRGAAARASSRPSITGDCARTAAVAPDQTHENKGTRRDPRGGEPHRRTSLRRMAAPRQASRRLAGSGGQTASAAATFSSAPASSPSWPRA